MIESFGLYRLKVLKITDSLVRLAFKEIGTCNEVKIYFKKKRSTQILSQEVLQKQPRRE